MGYVDNHLQKSHAFVFAGLLALFSVLTYLGTNAGLDQGPEHMKRVWQATAGTICGPLTGAISRGLQGCCLEFSLMLMKWCAPVLLLGVLAQFVGKGGGKWAYAARMSLWVAGWLMWFLGGIASFGHALS